MHRYPAGQPPPNGFTSFGTFRAKLFHWNHSKVWNPNCSHSRLELFQLGISKPEIMVQNLTSQPFQTRWEPLEEPFESPERQCRDMTFSRTGCNNHRIALSSTYSLLVFYLFYLLAVHILQSGQS